MKNEPRSKVIKRLLIELSAYKKLIALSLILSVFTSGFTLCIPIFAGRAIDNIVGKGEVNIPSVIINLVLIVVSAVLSALLQYFVSLINNKIAYTTVKDFKNRSFEHLNRLPLSYIDSHPYGDIVSRITSDADQFTDGVILGFSQLFTGVVSIVITLVFMLILNPVIALIVVVLTPMSLITAKFIASKTHSFFQNQSEIRGEQTSFIDEMIKNQKTVQAYSYEDRAFDRFYDINERLRKCSIKSIFFSSLVNPTTRFINNVIYAAVVLCGGFAILNGFLSVGSFVSFLSYANQYTKPFNEISGVMAELQNAFACVGRLFELWDIEPEKADNEYAVKLETTDGNVNISNLDFSYDKSKRVIKNLSLKAKSGQKIALVGPTGCGKTTLINLIMRFYDIDSGEISIDGINTFNITKNSLRNRVGMVLQETWIKNATVAENIAYGNPDATREEIINTAKKVKAHSFIMKLKDGYDTVISDSQSSLSAGEKQLICIARVMLCNPSILILDEATSSIDTRTEIIVQRAFKELMKGKTAFIVAHRLSTIMDADVIVVMKDGEIIEQGSHKELLALNGFYSNLYHSQFTV